jgi:hypothetical protein
MLRGGIAMPDKEAAGLPLGGVFVILALLLGYLVIPDQPFKTSRQAVQDAVKNQGLKSTHVEARLWEDPFAPVLRSKSYATERADECRHSNLTMRIAEKTAKNSDGQIVVLGVMVFGGEYAENVEMRRRSRYAVLSALAEEGFSPDRPDQLEYLDLRGSGRWLQSEANSLAVISYEFFSGPQPVVVLWLNEDLLGATPLKNFGVLAACLRGAVSNIPEAGHSCLPIKILGPAGSTTLQTMIAESNLPDTEGTRHLQSSPCGVEIFSWAATADENFLPQVVGENFPVRFYRTIGTDGQLMQALVDELELRGITPADHVALISEWDTIYGRNMPKTFARSAVGKIADENIYRFTYMRGIDGQISKANGGEKAPEASSLGSKKESRTEGIEKPVGNSQFDYLRRLSHDLKIKDLELRKTGGSIKAIGVLGSDIYDKLLVLQAVYGLFPGAIFFTTDLDARFLHPDELQWTRNLVIASSFGLRLHPALQKNTPPFRDSYQTSLFFATRLAMTPVIENPDTSDCLSACLRKPRIFEVGRTDAFSLKTEPDLQEDRQLCSHLISALNRDAPPGPSLHPDPEANGQTTFLTGAMMVPAAALLFLAAVCLVCERGWHTGRDTSLRVKAAAVALVALTTVAALLFWLTKSQKGSLEPLELLEGISLWPTVYLRFAAFGMAVVFLITIWQRSRRLEDELQDYFVDAKPRDTLPDTAAPEADLTPASCPEGLWEDYHRRNKLGARLTRVGPLVICYLVLCWAIINTFGQPFVPFRGDTSEGWCLFSLFLAVFFFVVLLFFVVDATSMTVWLIRQIQGGEGDWSRKRRALASERFGVDAEVSNDWIGIEVIAKLTDTDNKFIYYPILVIILLGISRLSYFDRWDMPAGLLLVILLGLGFSISCAIRLRGAAEQFRKDVLKRLWEKQLRLAGEGNESKGLSKKIDLMIDHIKSIRSGAFVPFIEQPWVRATLIFITSGGGLTVLQYLPWFQ